MSRVQSTPAVEGDAEPSRERLAVRLSPTLKETVERAAGIRGETLTEFVRRTISDAAWTIIRDYEVMTLSEQDSEAFLDALAHPPEPNDALRTAAARYAALVQRA